MRLQQRIEAFWWSPRRPPAGLRALSRVYGLVSRAHLNWRARHPERVAVPVISVGNLGVGGSGKTPFVLWLAAELTRQGRKPVLLCRGDGGTARDVQRVTRESDPSLVGDEACVLAAAGDWPVISARDRLAGARQAARLGDVIVLDDGFQYRQLARDCDIVLVPDAGLGNGCLLPAGPLREPVEALARADFIVCPSHPKLPGLPAHTRIWQWRAEADGIRDVMGVGQALRGRVLAVAGIARAERFFRALRRHGLLLEDTLAFPDHHRYRAGEVRRMLEAGLPVVTTGKDAVKLRRLWPADRALWVLEQRFRAEPELFVRIMARTFA